MQNNEGGLRGWKAVVFAVGVVLIAIGIANALGIGTSASSNAQAPTPTTAQKLATIQNGGPVSANDPLVSDFQTALDAMTAKCADPEIRISDHTVTSHNLLSKAGIDESYLDVLQHVNASIPDSDSGLQCGQIFALYVQTREKG